MMLEQRWSPALVFVQRGERKSSERKWHASQFLRKLLNSCQLAHAGL